MKAVRKISHVILTVDELPATCIEHWNRYWQEYADGNTESTNKYFETDISKVKFEKIVAFSTSEIRAWFLDKGDIAEGRTSGGNAFKFDSPSRYNTGDAAFFAAWDALHEREATHD